MTALPKNRKWTPEDYLAYERASDRKHELLDGEMYAMVGATSKHGLTQGAAYYSLYGQLRQRDCLIYANDMRVKAHTRTYFYPDIVVVCGEARFEDNTEGTLLNPILVIEVLSPSTERYDRGEKFRRYRTIETLQEYVLIAQDAPQIERFLRPTNGGDWLYADALGLDASLELTSIGCTLRLADVYEKISFESSAADDPADKRSDV